jgi:hypothetical protein
MIAAAGFQTDMTAMHPVLDNRLHSFLPRCLSLAWFLAVALAFAAQAAQAQENRLALVIGNASYKNSPLRNPVNDVRLMEAALREAGFQVIRGENVSLREMRRLVRDFGDRLKQTGGVGLFYFAGHGVQVRGENYLISVDSDIRNEDEVADDAINAQLVLEKMQSAGNRMNLVILDACRNNPFAVKSRTAAAGLAQMSAPSGSLVAYATAPGAIASDGHGRNGLYTEHLARAIRQPGLPVEEVFKQVRAAVRRDSANQQTPWENTALEGQFFFKPSMAAMPTAAPGAGAKETLQGASAMELAYWDSIKASRRPGELEAYLAQFPNGLFAGLVRARLAELSGSPPASPAPPNPPKPSAGTSQSAAWMPVISELAVGDTLGRLSMTDKLTGRRHEDIVRVTEATPERVLFSTGDAIDRDGQVQAVRLGTQMFRLNSGSLWRLPLQAGASGVAYGMIDPMLETQLEWRVIQEAGREARVETKVEFFRSRRYGTWAASYAGASPMPTAFELAIHSAVAGTGGPELFSGQLQQVSAK